MALNSINTNVAAYYAQSNIGKASTSASLSISRLSSGQRIVRASDDVAALSAGTSLRTNVTTLKQALVNSSQGSSLLQVADGALSQVTDILQRQKAIAVQAGSGSLTDSERSFLNEEFSNLSEEIDRLVSQTNFNGVNLLDGSLSESVNVVDNKAAANTARASINFAINPGDATVLFLNGQTFEADIVTGTTAGVVNTDNIVFTIGGTVQQTIDSLVTTLNSINNGSTTGSLAAAFTLGQADVQALTQAAYSREGNSLVIESRGGGASAQRYLINTVSATAITAIGAASVSGAGGTSSYIMFSGALGVASTTVVASAVAAAAATPFTIGQVLTAHTGVAGTTFTLFTVQANDTLQSLVDRVNAQTDTTGFTAQIIGRSGAYNIQLSVNRVTINGSYLTANATDITTAGIAGTVALAGGLLNANTTLNDFTYYLDNDNNNLGIGTGDVVGIGVVGNNLVTDQNQLRSEISLIFPDIADADLTSTTNFGQAVPVSVTINNPNVNFNAAQDTTFNFVTTSANGPTDVQLGDTLEETLDNLVAKINSYSGNDADEFSLSQFKAFRDGNTVRIQTIAYGNTLGIDGAAGINNITTNASFTSLGASTTNSGTLANGQNGGVSTGGITNSAFIGTISGFEASYGGTANTVNASVTIGDFTYTGSNIITNASTNTSVRFVSQDGGGYFDVQLRGGAGSIVTSQAGADTFANRLNAVFSSLEFYQNRDVSSYTGNDPIITDGVVSGTLIGSSFELQGTDFASVKIDYITATAPQGSSTNGSLVISINGEEYRTAGNIGSQLGAYQPIRLINQNDGNKILTFNTGAVPIDFSTDAKAASFETALEKAFGVGDGSAELRFQVGSTTADTLGVGINNISTRSIYGGQVLSVATAAGAAAASDVLDAALDAVTATRATVGALQSRFNFASANIESSLQNQDAARGVLLDTDIAAESTAFATSQVQLQAGIAVLAQANLLPQNLLKLIG